MADLQAYFDVIYEIRGNQENITQIEIGVTWEEALAIKSNSDLIVRVSFKILQEPVLISQKISVSKIIYESGQYNLELDGKYVVIGTYKKEDITNMVADIYYIQAD